MEEAPDEMEGVKFNGQNIMTVCYADDTAVVADPESQLQIMMNRIQDKCMEFGMKLNERKPMVMKISKMQSSRPLTTTVNRTNLKQVNQYN